MVKYRCSICKDTKVIEYYKLDNQTIYSWQKPLTKPCKCCK